VAARPGRQPSTAARLFGAVCAGSAAPAGLSRWGLESGARADFLVLAPEAAGILGLPQPAWLDGLVFASQGDPIRSVYVAGERRVHEGRHEGAPGVATRFEETMHQLWDRKG